METIDPATGKALPVDAIQRILFISNSVHVYNIPPLASNKGHNASSWTEDPKRHIFTCRVRVIETAIPQSDDDGDDKVKTDIVLEDPSNGQLFAAAPYTAPAVVEPCLDSSRFFALRVQDEAGRKATLGIGFEERPEAFDFSVCLQEARRALGLESAPTAVGGGSSSISGGNLLQHQGGAAAEEKRDLSLKEGETITVNLSGTKFGRRARPQEATASSSSGFSLPPPPGGGGGGFSLPPPPSAQDVKSQKQQAAKQQGFGQGS